MYITRDLEAELDNWLKRKDRRPVLVRGARQVGKTLLVRTWAEERFQDGQYLELNLEEQQGYRRLFEADCDTERILDELQFTTGKNLRKAPFLLFIDEIQVAPQAIMSLRYFYEKQPSLHVIAAGSLTDFVLEDISYPVGRIDTLYLSPMSFFEFLRGIGKEHFVQALRTRGVEEPIPETAHEELLLHLKKYFRVGGMPEAVRVYGETQDLQEVARIHERLIFSYRADFSKYAKRTDLDMLATVFTKVPHVVGNARVKYVRLDRDARSYKVKRALELLNRAGLVDHVYHTSARKLPLAMGENREIFKVLFLDIGLLAHVLGFDWSQVEPGELLTDIADGKLAEQFVGQEICAAQSRATRYELHYWHRQKKGSDAEVDYVIEYDGAPCPLEVKSGPRGSLKSLHVYNNEFSPAKALVLSQKNTSELESIKWVPLYMAGVL